MRTQNPVLNMEMTRSEFDSLPHVDLGNLKCYDKENAVTSCDAFISLRVVFAPGHGYQARVKLTEGREFVCVTFNYTESKMNAFRQAAEALGV